MSVTFPFRSACILWLAALAGTFAALPQGAVRADSTPATPGVDNGPLTADPETDKLLGPLFRDEIAGIKLNAPAGCTIINRANLELVSFIHYARQWGGDVQLVVVDKEMTVGEYIKASLTQLAKNFPALQVLDSREIDFQGRKAGRVTTSMEGDAKGAAPRPGEAAKPGERIALLRQQLLIQTTPKRFIVMTFYAPLKDKILATKTFEAMVGSFELLDRRKIEERRLKAIAAGKKWLSEHSADDLRGKLEARASIFRMKVNDNDIGYVRFSESEISRDGTTGVQLYMDSRSFPPDNSIVMGKNEAYWAYTNGPGAAGDRLHYSLWVNMTKSVVHKPTLPNGVYEFWFRESGLLQMDKSTRLTAEQIDQLRKEREELLKNPNLDRTHLPPEIGDPTKVYRLFVSRTGDPTQDFQEANKSFDATLTDNMPAPQPKLLEYLWPRFVDLTKPCEMTFIVYNSRTGKPAYRTLSVIGPDKIVLDRRVVDCIKVTDDLDPGSTSTWVDRNGKTLMVRTSDSSMLLPTTEELMAQLWGKRLEQIH